MNRLNQLMGRSGSYDLQKASSNSNSPKKGILKGKKEISVRLISQKPIDNTGAKTKKTVSFAGPFPTHRRPLTLTTSPSTSSGGPSSPRLSERKTATVTVPQSKLPSSLSVKSFASGSPKLQDALNQSWDSGTRKFDLKKLGAQLTPQEMPVALTQNNALFSDFLITVGNAVYSPSSSLNLEDLARVAQNDPSLSTIERGRILREANIESKIVPEMTAELRTEYQDLLNDMWDPSTKKFDLNSLTEHLSPEEVPQFLETANAMFSEYQVQVADSMYTPSSMANLLDLTNLVHPDMDLSNSQIDSALKTATPFKPE